MNKLQGIIYLNPIRFSEDIPIIAKLFDMRGKLVFSTKNITNCLDFSHLKNGMYFLETQSKNKTLRNKIIINKN